MIFKLSQIHQIHHAILRFQNQRPSCFDHGMESLGKDAQKQWMIPHEMLSLSWNAHRPSLSVAGLATGLATKLVACSINSKGPDLQTRLDPTGLADYFATWIIVWLHCCRKLHITVSNSDTETRESHFMGKITTHKSVMATAKPAVCFLQLLLSHVIQ